MTELRVTARGEREIVITREFEAPRALVFEAWTRPELLKRWLLGPPGWSMPVCEIDLRIGGAYRYVWRKGDTHMGVSGVYREIVMPERIVCTESFDDAWYAGEALCTIELAEREGRTTLTQTMRYESRQTRDEVLKSPMEGGIAASYDRLAEVLATAVGERSGA
jgi:uncharacterized protein YndB with AHSA1/START domain